MDVFLHYADQYLLDQAWAKLVPMSSFDAPLLQAKQASLNASQPLYTKFLTALATSLPTPLQPPPLVSNFASGATTAVSAWPRTYFLRQIISISTLTMVGIFLLYFIFATFSYYFMFDHRMMQHPRFLKNQVKMEIQTSVSAFPWMTLLTLPWFQGEVMGYSKLYDNIDEYGLPYLLFSIPFFLIFTDYCIYWIHRWLHIPFIYKRLHKPHHKWIIPTPFASHAFHPVDGYLQSVPYHFFVFVFPMHRYLYVGLFVAVNFWSIFIHDSDMLVSSFPIVEKLINTPAHHTLHHIYFTCNYGQYFTWADRSGGSYRAPESDLDPLIEVLAARRNAAALKSSALEEKVVAATFKEE